MQAFMTFITNNYWVFIILTAVCGIAIVGYNVEGKKESSQQLMDKAENEVISNPPKQEETNTNDNIIMG